MQLDWLQLNSAEIHFCIAHWSRNSKRALVHFSHDLPMAKWQNGEIANGKMDKLAILIITHFALVLVWTQNTQQTKSSNQ